MSLLSEYYQLLDQAQSSSFEVDAYDLESGNPVSVTEFKQLEEQSKNDSVKLIRFIKRNAVLLCSELGVEF